MKKFAIKELPVPGMRNFKTCFALFLCFALYHFLDRTGVLLAAFGAILSMQDSMEKSMRDGFNRVFGTVVGGVFGVIVLNLQSSNAHPLLMYMVSALGVSILIYLGVLMHKNASITISCFVFLIIVTEPLPGDAITYAVDRVIDTTIGICVAVVVNRFFFNPDSERFSRNNNGKSKIRLPYVLKRVHQHKISNWKGGTSTEIAIFPPDALYINRNFKWRLAMAKVDLEESHFIKLQGFWQHLLVIDGDVRIVHDGQHAVCLTPYGQDSFDGGWDTMSFGAGQDVNLIINKKYNGSMCTVFNHATCALEKTMSTGFFAMEDGVVITVCCEDVVVLEVKLEKYDFIGFNGLEKNTSVFSAVLSKEGTSNALPLAIQADVWHKPQHLQGIK